MIFPIQAVVGGSIESPDFKKTIPSSSDCILISDQPFFPISCRKKKLVEPSVRKLDTPLIVTFSTTRRTINISSSQLICRSVPVITPRNVTYQCPSTTIDIRRCYYWNENVERFLTKKLNPKLASTNTKHPLKPLPERKNFKIFKNHTVIV